MTFIRFATPSDVDTMRTIEMASGKLFADIGMQRIADDEPVTVEVLLTYIVTQRAWISEVNEQATGYALVDVVDGTAHLEQVSVDPRFGRRRIGQLLIEAVADWARTQHFPSLTLLTFRDVPWNGPYYERLGFRPIPDADLAADLRALRLHEGEIGLDAAPRWAMRLDMPA